MPAVNSPENEITQRRSEFNPSKKLEKYCMRIDGKSTSKLEMLVAGSSITNLYYLLHEERHKSVGFTLDRF
jgi:hypothetical protein